jgi:mannose-1-phosphate guanylyltransferase/mannose-6-phosphate isomerase
MSSNNQPDICPVILSGGSGTRLWPLSRELYPKQLLPLASERTMLQETVGRVSALPGMRPPVVVCNEEHRFLVAEQIRQLGGTSAGILLEPAGRNTAPALTLAVHEVMRDGRDPVLLVMPADHVIQDKSAFSRAVAQGALLAQAGHLVTFGIVPDSPETGYGYIRKGDILQQPGAAVAASGNACKVRQFVEKPDLDTAQKYLDSGEYLWNSGIFMLRGSVWLEELGRLRPDITQACSKAYENGARDGDFFRVDKAAFSECPSDSIDYAVMEKTERASVIPLDAGWSDLGAWPALWGILSRDSNGNVVQGDVLTQGTRNSLLISQHRLVAIVGVEDIVVVETSDAVLVMHKDKAQDVKHIVAQLKSENRDECRNHRRVFRPWGCYEGIDAGQRFQVKRITVSPGASLSLQMHHHRAEHWVVVTGTARITRDDEVFMLTENQSTYIPLGTKHRLENPGSIPLEMIEVQSGSYLGEDDIVRYDDVYNRHQK